MKIVKISDIFEVDYGNKFDLNKMKLLSRKEGGISFVGRSAQNNGVTNEVAPIEDSPPYPAGLITLALGGAILSTFVQPAPFYTGQNIAVLKPKIALTIYQKIYVCQAIFANKTRYSAFGREANKTFKTIQIPHPYDAPYWVNKERQNLYSKIQESISKTNPPALSPQSWKPFVLDNIFDIKKGKRLTKAHMTEGTTPFIGATDQNNGITNWVGQEPIHKSGTITVSYNGSVAEAFYQPQDFWASDDVNVLYPRFFMPAEVGIFIATIIRQEKYRFNYGRKWHLERMNKSVIYLPADTQGNPDTTFMTGYIQALPFSSSLLSA